MKATLFKRLISCFWIIPVVLASTVASFGATFCVGDEMELQTALTTAAGNGEDDTIRMVRGIYNGNFEYTSDESHALTLEGGYASGCTSRTLDPGNTILDGGGVHAYVLSLRSSVAADFSVEGVTIQHGSGASPQYVGGGLYAGIGGHVVLAKNVFTRDYHG